MTEPGLTADLQDPQQQQQELLLRDELDALNAALTKQGAQVRTLKKEGGTADAIAAAVNQLQALKIAASEKSVLLAAVTKTSDASFQRRAFDDLVLRKMFVVPSFEIHGGVKGLFDLGPPACALKVCACLRACACFYSVCCIECFKVFWKTFFPHTELN